MNDPGGHDAAEATTPTLRAGAAAVDITPALGTHLSGSGMGERRGARSVLDPLYARAVVLESGDRRVCLISLDATIVTADYTERIRAGVAAQAGVEPAAILVHAVQTHSAPSLGYFMLDPDFPLHTTAETEYLRGAERVWSDLAAAAAVRAAVTAAGDLQPVRVGVGRGLVAGDAFNRRGVGRDGTILMPKPQGRAQQPLGITELSHLEGPMDPELGVLCLRRPDGATVAALLHYTCHPVNVFGQRDTYYDVSADWCGALAGGVQGILGGDAVAMVLNGCCGNLNPWHPFDPEHTPDHRRMGASLTTMAGRILDTLAYADEARLEARVRHIDLAYREIPPARREEVERLLRQHPEPPRGDDGEVDPTWFRAASTRSVELCRAREPVFDYEIQALRIGDTAVVGLPGEPFVEGQLAIKLAAPSTYTFPTHLTTQYVGYLPTRDAYARGGHEANEDVTYWAKFAPGCLEQVVDETVDLVGELFAEGAAQ